MLPKRSIQAIRVKNTQLKRFIWSNKRIIIVGNIRQIKGIKQLSILVIITVSKPMVCSVKGIITIANNYHKGISMKSHSLINIKIIMESRSSLLILILTATTKWKQAKIPVASST